jgi:quinoprotein dehydrogenase-associated probable ABC transporter substrate-binding protein
MTGWRPPILALLGAAGLVGGIAPAERADAAERELRVCADPNNLPFSDQQGQGFENRIAELVAGELDARLSYTWWAQRRGFIRNTLNAGACDLVIGVPAGYELVDTTSAYYRSAYVYVYRADRGLDLRSMQDPRLRQLRIGVHLIGDDGANPPPAHALGRQGIVDNVVGYMIYGDYREPSPTARIIDAVAAGDIDLAMVWGPIGGYFARQASVPLTAVPITDTAAFAPLRFEFGVAMGVRKGDHALREELDGILERRREDLEALLDQYGVPRVEAPGAASGGGRPDHRRRSAEETG